MANITLGNNPIKTIGNLPEIGEQAKDLCLIANDLSNRVVIVHRLLFSFLMCPS